METFSLWNGAYPGAQTEEPVVTYYPAFLRPQPEKPEKRAAVIIFPGGGYVGRAKHEGEGYAQLLNTFGVSAFVVDYRVSPAVFPDELLDARRAVRFVRANSKKFGIDKERIAGWQIKSKVFYFGKRFSRPCKPSLTSSEGSWYWPSSRKLGGVTLLSSIPSHGWHISASCPA